MYEVVKSTERFAGRVFSVVTDEVMMPSGQVAERDCVKHIGAVGVVALDEQQRVVLVRQYRHPVRRHLWELPAGLIDMAGEDLSATALRELAEEADLTAARIDLLVDLFTTPGASDEMIRIFLARDLAEVPDGQRHARHDEEADLQVARVPLDEAVRMAMDGRITNGPAVAGLLAASVAVADGYASLRPARSPVA